jgi:hypothetical protein
MPQHLENARHFRERAEQLRRVASSLAGSPHREAVEQVVLEYERMAEAEAAKIMVKLNW